jgi:choline dehydrogenase-like flavoprotein
MDAARDVWDAVIVGSGFGGAMTALQLVRAGKRVLLLERGGWADRDASAWDPRAILVEGKYKSATPYLVGRRRATTHSYEAVGGNSVLYGAASLRFREADFEMASRFPRPRRSGDGLVDWPLRYGDLEPHYAEAERLLGVVGVAGSDPTEPPRREAYPGVPPPYGTSARLLADAATDLGLRPFPLPLAINFGGQGGRPACIQCTTCDLFPCRIMAKNDLSVTVLPEALRGGATLRPRTIARALVMRGGRVDGVECVDAATAERFTVRCRLCIVSCGAIATTALLLRSGLGAMEPNGRLIGRYLQRHCSGIVVGALPRATNPEQRFNKQVGIADFYFGPPAAPREPWGLIQALQVPPAEYFVAGMPPGLGQLAARTARFHLYALCIGHEVPNVENRVELVGSRRDRWDMEVARVSHRYHPADLAGRRALYGEAARILRRAGALVRFPKPINTFSHAVGTCRFGADPERAVLDPWCGFFGVPNLFVVDGSFMPTSGAVNPSLTIAANALRVGGHLAAAWRETVAASA